MNTAVNKNAVPGRVSFPKGTTIFKEGEKADCAYILEKGSVQIFKMVGGKRIQLGTIRNWGIFGELAIIDDSPRMAAAYAGEDSVCVVITKQSISDMLDGAPQGLRVLINSMVATIRTAGDDLAEARSRLRDSEQS